MVAAPVLWALVDLVGHRRPAALAARDVASSPTTSAACAGCSTCPGSFVSFVGATVRPPVALLAPVGARAGGARATAGSALRVPLALFAAGVITFVGTGALGLSILPRYLTVPAIALCLFAGYALLGFTALARDHAWRRRWAQGSAAATVVGALGLIVLAPSLTNVREELRFIRATHDSLIAMLDDPAVRAGLRCGTLTFPTYRLVPDARWHLPDAHDRRPLGPSAATAASRSSRSARRRCAATASPPAPRRRSTCRATGSRRSRGMAS